jgi:hypothetical protein
MFHARGGQRASFFNIFLPPTSHRRNKNCGSNSWTLLFSSQFLVATKTNWNASHQIFVWTRHKIATTTMTLSTEEEHARPSPMAPHVPTDSYAVAVTVAVAVEVDQPVKTSSLQTQQGVTVTIEFQANTDSVIVFGGDLLRVVNLTHSIPSLAREGTNIEGYYFHSLRLPGLEIKNVHELELKQIVTANRHLPRSFVVSTQLAPTSKFGCQYKHDLPCTNNLGIQFSGFPAKVHSVDKDSPMAGKIHPGQFVYAVIVPGFPDLKMESGGFTGSRVEDHLQAHYHLTNKQIVVSQKPTLVQDKTSDAAFDSCNFWKCFCNLCDSCCLYIP